MNDDSNPPIVSEVTATGSLPQANEPIGSAIGPYKLLQVIGEGGMGTVYLAQQEKPVRRRVALKIIKPGMDSKQVVARFEAERQALSMMEHPHIAQVLDVGTTVAGRPYFVMELVKGLPITQYCDEKRLTLNRRLALFRSICHAVQHAHQKGIIHRDIKPSNVLVAEFEQQATPKIIDFGLAKALHHPLTDKTLFTQLGQVVGTLEYMSPEQSRMNQLDVDTRTDIYSLGVLLYELLIGALPFEQDRIRSVALDQVLTIIREEEPPKPSTRFHRLESSAAIAANRNLEPKRLEVLLRGDLDWIVMKAIDKDRDRRYESANGLGMDIQRYLEGDPVTAAPPSAGYRLRKFAKRNRVAVVVSLLVASALVLAVVGTSIGMALAFVENTRANKQTQLAIKAKESAELARSEALYSQYVSNIPAANSFLSGNSTVLARSILRATPAEHRNFEWAFLANRAWPHYPSIHDSQDSELAVDATARQFWQHGTAQVVREIIPSDVAGGLNVGQFSADGESIFLALASGVIKQFSLETGEQIASYATPSGTIITASVSPDGKIVGGFTFSSRLSIWDVDKHTLLASHPNELQKNAPWICRWSPDNKFIASSHMGGTIRIWDASTSELEMLNEWTSHQQDVLDVFISRSGDYLLTASLDKTIQKWSFPGGILLGVYSAPTPTTKDIEFQGISPSGQLAVTVCADGSSFLWKIETEQVSTKLAETDPRPYVGDNRFAASFSGDESCVVVMTGRLSASLFDVASGTLLNSIVGHGNPLRSIHLSPAGNRVLTISEDNRARIWGCVPKPPTELSHAHRDIIFQFDIDAAATQLLIGSFDSTASVWNLKTKRRENVYTGHDAPIVAVDFNANGDHAATLDALGNLHVWEGKTGVPLFVIDPESDEFARHIGASGGGLRKNVLNFPAVLSTGLFTPDGSRVVAFHQDSMKVFNARTGKVEAVLQGAESSGWPVYSHDSSLVAVLEMNRQQVGVWDIRAGKLLTRLVGHREPLVMMAFSPVDNRLVTSVMESKLIIWDASSGRQLQVLDEQAGAVSSCRFSNDGQFVLVGYSDSTARVWESHTGQLITTMIGHTNRIRDVRLSPDHTRLLSWGMDDKAIIWDLAQPLANQLLVLGGNSKLLQAHWAPDGREIVTAWADGSIHLWSGATRKDVLQCGGGDGDFENTFEKWRRQYMNND